MKERAFRYRGNQNPARPGLRPSLPQRTFSLSCPLWQAREKKRSGFLNTAVQPPPH